jgi:ABC-type Fe3+-hydroxamate transport system substrate-binding protein
MSSSSSIFIDQVGRSVLIKSNPQRIISIVPSQTELLYDLGLNEEVAGITKFCIHPDAWFHSKRRVGGTKKLNFDVIRELNPDLILANKEENTKEELEVLMQEFPVWISDIKNVRDALAMIAATGKMCNRIANAEQLIIKIREQFNRLPAASMRTAIYFIWDDPMMIAGADTFITDMMQHAGFQNAASHLFRYPVVEADLIKRLQPEYILLSSEPFPFKEKQKQKYEKLFPDSRILLVDGEFFSWYGSRMLMAPEYFRTLAM